MYYVLLIVIIAQWLMNMYHADFVYHDSKKLSVALRSMGNNQDVCNLISLHYFKHNETYTHLSFTIKNIFYRKLGGKHKGEFWEG